MKFSATLFAALVATVSAGPLLLSKRVDANLVPQFGHAANVNPTGTGDCDGAVPGVKVPCACPPDRNAFIAKLNANVAAGHATNNPGIAVAFPTDSSKASQLARMNTALVTLQNLNGPGQGCPASSTTFVAQQKAIQDFNGAAAPAPAPAAPAPAAPAAPKPAAPAPAAAGALGGLAPQLNFAAGKNPTGTGDCDGAVSNASGAIKIPCTCPPSQADFDNALAVNVAAGHAVNNPGVGAPFPTSNSKADQITRLNTGLITLQNLRGPGVGCPAVSSTFQAQIKALQ